MANVAIVDSTLTAIRTKVRRLTRSPSTAQLSNAEIDSYVNTFVLYDFPEQLRLFSLRTNFTFWTNPFQDVYPTDNTILTPINPLFDFRNKYITVHEPVFIAGYRAFYSQAQDQFFGIYPFINSILSIGTTGDGITTTFTGVINSQQAIVPTGFNQKIGLLQNKVLFSSVNTTNDGLAMVDVPVIDPLTGNPTTQGNLYVAGQQPDPATPPIAIIINNNIDYVTGVFTVTFPTAPGAGQIINSQTVPYQAGLPQSLLYYDNKFTVRPVPDQPYAITFEAYIRPTELLATNQKPELEQWWQYIAYGAAKKVFEDRMDLESVQLIMPEFKQQERFVLRRTIVLNTNERVATIYTENNGWGYGSGWGGGSF